VKTLSGLASLQTVGYWLANLMLVLLGLYLMHAWNGLARLEQAGGMLWRRAQPLTRKLLPMDTLAKALALGALWGWAPCGMVYSMLLTAMLSSSALSGAAVMAAFGLGTLPMLLALGTAGTQLRAWMQRRNARIAAGTVVLLFGVIGLARAAANIMPHWGDVFCVTPAIQVWP
jgi:sulfite exporter TauE/SafE